MIGGDKHIVIIGTGEHMGRATAALLLREGGARVTLNSRNRARLDRLASSGRGGRQGEGCGRRCP